MHKRHGHDNRCEPQHALAVYVVGIPAVLSDAVGEDVHDLQALQGEEAQGRKHQICTEKQQTSAEHHSDQHQYLWNGPENPAGFYGIGDHCAAYQNIGERCQSHILADHLEYQRFRTHQQPIELALPDDLLKRVKSPGKAFGNVVCGHDHPKAQKDFAQRMPAHDTKPVHQNVNAEQAGKRIEQPSTAGHEKGHRIGHLALKMNGKEFQIKSHGLTSRNDSAPEAMVQEAIPYCR